MKKNNSKKSLQGGKKEMELIQVRQFECLRCDHKWQPRIERKPLQCPQCKSPYWDRPRTKFPSNKQNEKLIKA